MVPVPELGGEHVAAAGRARPPQSVQRHWSSAEDGEQEQHLLSWFTAAASSARCLARRTRSGGSRGMLWSASCWPRKKRRIPLSPGSSGSWPPTCGAIGACTRRSRACRTPHGCVNDDGYEELKGMHYLHDRSLDSWSTRTADRGSTQTETTFMSGQTWDAASVHGAPIATARQCCSLLSAVNSAKSTSPSAPSQARPRSPAWHAMHEAVSMNSSAWALGQRHAPHLT